MGHQEREGLGTEDWVMRQRLSARGKEVSQIPKEPPEGKGGNNSVFPEGGPCEREAGPDSLSERGPGSSPSMEDLPSLGVVSLPGHLRAHGRACLRKCLRILKSLV